MERLIGELRSWYLAHTLGQPESQDFARRVWLRMDAFDQAHPGLSPYLLKSTLHEVIADEFEPVVFAHSPFFFEMGAKPSESWGVPSDAGNAGGWMFMKRSHRFFERNPRNARIRELRLKHAISLFYGIFPDSDHHCFPSTVVVENGLKALYQRAEAQAPRCEAQAQSDFIEAVKRSLLAVRRVADKFADKAERLLPGAPDEQARRFLQRIAQSARRVPWEPASSFYEGLAVMWFLREVCSSLEGIGVSVIGHPDRLLDRLYRADLASGALSENEAFDLICRFLLPTDNKRDFTKPTRAGNYHETSTTLMLGGANADGSEVDSPLTMLFLKAHEKLGLLNPKLNCRYSARSPRAYLNEINRQILSGRNVFALFNDDCLVEAHRRAGKRVEDARRYVAGGCHEPILEGFEHSAGACCYINMPRLLDLSIHPHPEIQEELAEIGLGLRRLDGARDFEDVYARLLANIGAAAAQTAALIGENGKAWPEVNPSPFFSAAMADCIENRRDYTAGGARYSPTGLPFVGFANIVDSLYALKRLCFDTRRCRLEDALDAVRADWRGHEDIKREVAALPKFGQDEPGLMDLSRRLGRDLCGLAKGLKNERDGDFQPSFFAYLNEFIRWGRMTSATPDGRAGGERLSQGISPARGQGAATATSVINSATAVDMAACPGNAILDVHVPMGATAPDALRALEMAFAAQGGATLQINCMDARTLLEARRRPEQHQDLIVRVCGFSARFTSLSAELQDDVIRRYLPPEVAEQELARA